MLQKTWDLPAAPAQSGAELSTRSWWEPRTCSAADVEEKQVVVWLWFSVGFVLKSLQPFSTRTKGFLRMGVGFEARVYCAICFVFN